MKRARTLATQTEKREQDTQTSPYMPDAEGPHPERALNRSLLEYHIDDHEFLISCSISDSQRQSTLPPTSDSFSLGLRSLLIGSHAFVRYREMAELIDRRKERELSVQMRDLRLSLSSHLRDAIRSVESLDERLCGSSLIKIEKVKRRNTRAMNKISVTSENSLKIIAKMGHGFGPLGKEYKHEKYVGGKFPEVKNEELIIKEIPKKIDKYKNMNEMKLNKLNKILRNLQIPNQSPPAPVVTSIPIPSKSQVNEIQMNISPPGSPNCEDCRSPPELETLRDE